MAKKKANPLKGAGAMIAMVGLGVFLYVALRPRRWRVYGAAGEQFFDDYGDAYIATQTLREGGLDVRMEQV